MSYNTYITFDGDGSTKDFAIPFTYLKQEDVVVTRQNGPVSFVFVSPNIIRVSTAIDVGDLLTIERRTSISTPSVVFNNGSSFTGDNINNALTQLRFALQEATDRTGTVYASVYDINSIESLFNGTLTQFTLSSGGSNLGQVALDSGLWVVSMNGSLLEPVTDYTISVVSGSAKITFVEAPQVADNASLKFIRFYDGVAAGGGGGGEGTAFTLDDLDDVTINAPVLGQTIVYNGTQWVNSAGSSGGTSGGSGGIDIVTTTPTSCSIAGKAIYNSTLGKLYICKDGSYVDIFEAYTPDAPDGITIVDTLPTGCTAGQIVLLRSDYKLYTCVGGSWQALVANITSADILSGLYSGGARPVEYVNALPTTGNVAGRLVFLTTNNQLYIYKGGAWVLLKDDLTPTAPSGIEVVSTNPTTGNYVERTVFNTTDNKLYKYTSSGWVQVVEPTTAAAEVADGALTTAKFASGIRPVEIVSLLPTTGNVEGRLVYLTSDDKLYRYNGTSFISGLAATDITGQLTSGQLAANSVIAGKIQAGAISATEIAADAINASKIAAGAITAEKIAALAITAEKINSNAITSDKIAANSIVAGKIQAGAIGTTELAAGAITADKLGVGSVVAGKISAGSIGASEIAALSITGSKIQAGTIDGSKIIANSITSGLIQAGAIGAEQIQGRSITAAKLTVDEELITSNAQIANATITTLKLAGNSVTQAQAFNRSAYVESIGSSYTSVLSGSVSVSGTQPIIVMVTWTAPNQRVASSSGYDFFESGQYWYVNTYLTGQSARVTLGGQTSTLEGLTLMSGGTGTFSFIAMFNGVSAGTHTLSLQLQTYSGQTNVRTANMVFLETKR